jgi:crossover junction endodeoxyribonuclease RusA
MHYEFYLAWPPTVNSYYVQTRNGRFISSKGKAYRESVNAAIIEQLPDTFIDTPMLVECVMYPPDERTRDIDNYMKAMLDAITKAGLWEDDVLINQLFIYRGVKAAPSGSVFIRISDAGPCIPIGLTDF